MLLASPERDNASGWVVGRNPHGNPISGHDFDAKASHPSAQLGQHLVTRVTLNPVESATMDSHHGPLNVDEVVFCQRSSCSGKYSSLPPLASFVPPR